jgi:hypothetical protein
MRGRPACISGPAPTWRGGGKSGESLSRGACRTRMRPPVVKMSLAHPPSTGCAYAAAAARAANAEGRVWVRGLSASQAVPRITLSAVASSRCMSRVFTNPRYRERRRSPRRVPCAIVPSMPARRAYTGLKVSVCCCARAAWRAGSWSRARRRKARGAGSARGSATQVMLAGRHCFVTL